MICFKDARFQDGAVDLKVFKQVYWYSGMGLPQMWQFKDGRQRQLKIVMDHF
jgi:hypothetical protein